MAGWCLPPNQVDAFKKAILSGRINPANLATMSSAERRALFAKELGDINAEPVNAAFESKLLLKNKQAGYISWAKKMLGEKTPAGRDVISRVGRMNKILSPADEKAFLSDLAKKRLGTEVSFNEAKQIAVLSSKVNETKAKMEAGTGDRLDYGHSVVELRNYVSDLKNQANKLTFADIKKNPIKSLGRGIVEAAGTAKAIKASMDNSAIFRQGWKTLWTNPIIWQKNARQSFVDLVRQFGGKEVLNELDADLVSRPNALNNYYRKAGLDLGTLEEQFPTHLPEKVPVLGRAYKASEAAYTGFVRRMRADVFDKMIDVAKKSDVELSNDELASIGKMVNSLTGRGHLGKLEPAANAINSLLFSPRFIKSNIDLFLQPISGAGGSDFVRKQAAINLVKVLAGTAAVLAVSRAVKKDSVEEDPRSADFGKIRIGDTRFDMTGGMASLATLAARLATNSTKSSTSGEVQDLGALTPSGKPAFGAPTRKDVVYNFFENKLSPAASLVRDILKGQDREGNPVRADLPTLGRQARNLFEPLPITNFRELKNNPNSAPILLATLADALGIATNTYSAKPKSEQQLKRETKQQDEGLSPAQVSFSNIQYANQALDRFERMNPSQQDEVRGIMARKAWNLTHSDSLADEQKAAYQQRLDQLGITPEQPKKATGFKSGKSGFSKRFSEHF